MPSHSRPVAPPADPNHGHRKCIADENREPAFESIASRTKMPAGLPRIRNTLVAPMLPLPTVRMSMPARFATRKPVGIEPSR